MITSFTQIGMVKSVFGVTKTLTNLGMGTLIGTYRFFRDMEYFVGPLLLGAIADIMGLITAFYATSLILLTVMTSIQIHAKETIRRAKL